MHDISAQVFGKYQCCTMAKDGLYYADCDMLGGGVCKGALPAPAYMQNPDRRAEVEGLHQLHSEIVANSIIDDLTRPRSKSVAAPKKSLWQAIKSRFGV